VSAFGQTKPSMWSRIQFSLSENAAASPPREETGVAGSTETTSLAGSQVPSNTTLPVMIERLSASRWFAAD